MSEQKEITAGFIGLGIMGLPMALNAQKAGFRVVGYNRGADRQRAAKEAGIEILNSPRAVADRSDVIVVMVTDPKAVQSVLLGVDGVLEGHVREKTLIQMSTLDVKSTLHFARDCAERQMYFIDCPVTGSKAQVEAAQLILLAGGHGDMINHWRSFLLTMGKTIVHAGDVGKGTALKLCMNLIVSQMTTALAEGTALARVLEVEPERVFDVITASPALNCGYFQIKKKNILEEDFSPAFSLNNMLKDVRFMTEAAKEKRLMLPVINAARFLMEGAVQEGWGEKDLSSISAVLKPKISQV